MSFIRSKLILILKNHWPLATVGTIALALLLWTSPKFVKMLDEGMLASTAFNISQGQVLYRDVFEFWTPLSVYITASAFSLFGVTVFTLRTLAAVLLILNTICVYYLLRHICRKKLFILLNLLAFIGITYSFVEMNHHWLGMLFLFLTLIAFEKLIKVKSLAWAAWSGFGISLTFLSVQLEGVIAIGSCLAVLLLWFKPVTKSNIKIWLVLVGVSVVPILTTILYFATQNGLYQLVYSTVVFPVTQYRSVNGDFGNITQFAQLLVIAVVSRFWLKHFPSEMARLWLIATGLFQLCFIFTANTTVVTRYGFFPAIVVLGCMVAFNWGAWVRSLSNSLQLPMRIIQGLVFTSLVVIGGVNVVADTVAAWRNTALATSKVTSPAGTMYARPEMSDKAQTIIDYVTTNTAPNEPVYFGPFAAQYQFLTHRSSPIPYSQLTPSYNPDWMFTDAVSRLKESRVNTIVFLPQENPFAFGSDNQLSQFIKTHYQPVIELPFTTLLSSKKLYLLSYRRQLTNAPQDAIWELK